jgi:hypothetical protein
LLDDLAGRCNLALVKGHQRGTPPRLPLVDRGTVIERAKRFAEAHVASIGPGRATLGSGKMFPFLRPPTPRYIA